MFVEQLKLQDDEFISVQEQAAVLDPIYFGKDFDEKLLHAKLVHDIASCVEIHNITLDRAVAWAEGHSISESDPAVHAVIRDTDRVIGSLISLSGPDAGNISARSKWSHILLSQGFTTPRATIYTYLWASKRPNSESYRSFTGDKKEQIFIPSVGESLRFAHCALWKLLSIRARFEHGKNDDKTTLIDDLSEVAQNIKAIRDSMPLIYREVGAGFVSMKILSFFRGYFYNGRLLSGPNPSASAFYALDQAVFGNFNHLREDPNLSDQLDNRVVDMPRHLQQTVKYLDIRSDTSPLKTVVADFPDAVKIASQINKYLWQFKHVHKSYADEGLAAKGKTLDPSNPDLLSGLLRLAKENRY